jgi:pre-mRNA-splicing helicase BRR2
MSSLVLSSDRRGRGGQDEPNGDPESLVGRIDYKTMGTRAFRETVDTGKAKKKASDSKRAREDGSAGSTSKKPRTDNNHASSNLAARDILAAADVLEGMEYIPRTSETRQVYELILAAVHEALGGESPQDVLRDATDFVIVTLKDDSLKDFDRKKEISSAIPGLSTEQFTTFVNLGKKITDFGSEDAENGNKDPDDVDARAANGAAAMDDDVGVAVVFEEEDEEDQDRIGDEDDENAAFEVRDESDEDDDIDRAQVNQNGAGDGAPKAEGANDDEEREIIIGDSAGPSAAAKRSNKDSDVVLARDIDGFWLQRLISTAYPDPHETATKTNEAMTILSSESNTRDVENSLMDLFDYDNEKFGIVRVFLKNREKIVWCTKLARSDADARVDVEVAMREKGVGWILKELASSATLDGPASGKQDDTMQVDAAAAPSIPKTNITAGSLVQPKGTVDLESMAFTQGGRLMTNKKCKLPEGSFKRSKKGYEEIHVPPPAKKVMKPGELVDIGDLPTWAQAAFKGAKQLNPVQSKLYPVAFGDDDPILLCAPTGAGKVSSP